MVTLTPLAENLNALLTLAESLEGKQRSTEKNPSASFVERLITTKDRHQVEKSFSTLNALFKSLQAASDQDLQKAFRDLKARGAHKTVMNPIESLLMCKYRLNALLVHIAQKQHKGEDLALLKITWMPSSMGDAVSTLATKTIDAGNSASASLAKRKVKNRGTAAPAA